MSLKTGDLVEYSVAPAKTIFSAFLVLIVPLLLFLAFFLFARHILGAVNDLLCFAAGLPGMALGFLLSGLYSKKSSDIPVIVSIMPRAGTTED